MVYLWILCSDKMKDDKEKHVSIEAPSASAQITSWVQEYNQQQWGFPGEVTSIPTTHNPFHLSMKIPLIYIPRSKILVHSSKIPSCFMPSDWGWENELREMLMKFFGMRLNTGKHELHCPMQFTGKKMVSETTKHLMILKFGSRIMRS